MATDSDKLFLQLAVELAARGLYTTTPNPRVGCVLVRDGAVIGRGWHKRGGWSARRGCGSRGRW